MAALPERPQFELRGLSGRGTVQGAVLVLEGAPGSDLRRASELAAIVADRCLLVAVDGGLATCVAARRRPDLFVGDGDSVARIPPEVSSVVFPTDKEFSDLAGALAEVRKRGARVVIVAGLLGGRLDHEWANVFELGRAARSFVAMLAPSERGTVLITRHGCRVATVRRRTVSLFCLTATASVS